LEAAARAVNAPFLSTHERRRPWVTLKAAQSLDGRISAAGGSSTWVTGPAARRYAHRLRFRHDAVLVGAGTVRRDDPSLTVRLPGVEAPRLRAVLAPRLGLDPGARVFSREVPTSPPTRVYVAKGCSADEIARFREAASVVPVGEDASGLDLHAVLADLRDQGVQSLLVEGGGKTAGTFLGQGLVDEVVLFIAKRLFGATGAAPVVDLPAVASPDRAWQLGGNPFIPLGCDDVLVGRLVAP
jgi:diaminohydroxyphosphoribosylaminopyrimidine deaminase/5-amino-6-(5-phosphoribosylamino)uracil reductase